MRKTTTPQQTAFFTQNGYIEFEELVPDIELLMSAAQIQLASRLDQKVETLSQQTASRLYVAGRDLWREEPLLKNLLIHKLGPTVLALTGKNLLRLGCDQWIPSGYPLEKHTSAQALFSIQGLVLCAALSLQTPTARRPSPLGILPLPAKSGSVLFFKPNLLLDWSRVSHAHLYLAAFALPKALYVQNIKDPATNSLKSFGYGFGDPLNTETHPLIENR